MTPLQELEALEARDLLYEAVRLLLGKYVRSRRPQVKRLALWAHVADVDPTMLLTDPQRQNNRILAALLDAVASGRFTGRTIGVAAINAKLVKLVVGGDLRSHAPFTAIQFGTHLSRLRKDFRDAIGKVCDPEKLQC